VDKKKSVTILGPSGAPLSFVGEHAVVRNTLNQSFSFNPFQGPSMSDIPGTPKINTIDSLADNLRFYLFSNFRQILAQAYVEIGLFGTICDVPVDDALRGGIEITSKQLGEKNINDLLAYMEEKDDLGTVGGAMKWSRCFGGGAIIPIVEGQDPEKELDLEGIKEGDHIEFRDVDLWELFSQHQNTDSYSQYEPDPSLNYLQQEFFQYYKTKLHKSRVFKFMGRRAPSFIRPRLRGWGLSEIEATVRSFNQYIKNANVAYELVDEMKLDIFKLKGLAAALQTVEGEQLAMRRIRMANARKNYLNATALDSEDDFQQRQISFSGLGEVSANARMQVASDLKMPLTKIFGISAAGFNSGEDDIETYNGMIESTLRPKARPNIIKVVKMRSMEMYGVIPDDLTVAYKPLRVLGAVDEQTIKTGKLTGLLAARGANEISKFEFREAVNRERLMGITLDTDADKLNPDDPMIEEILADDGTQPEATEAAPPKAGAGKKPENDAKDAPTKPTKPVKNDKQSDLAAEFLGFAGPRIVSVGIIAKGDLLCGKRRDNGLWTSPGGHMDEGEIPEESAIREVYEETGVELDPSDLRKVALEKVVSHRTGKEFMVCCYVAYLPEKPFVSAFADPDHEVSEWKWVPISEDSPELNPNQRHAKKDAIVGYLFGLKNAGISNPGKVDEGLWAKAKRASEKALGKIKYPFVTWWYKHHGGTFE
jgi:phage-related protein (TIGR01555 family)